MSYKYGHKSQVEYAKEHLLKHGSIDEKEAFSLYEIKSLATVIHLLKKRYKFVISKEKVEVKRNAFSHKQNTIVKYKLIMK